MGKLQCVIPEGIPGIKYFVHMKDRQTHSFFLRGGRSKTNDALLSCSDINPYSDILIFNMAGTNEQVTTILKKCGLKNSLDYSVKEGVSCSSQIF